MGNNRLRCFFIYSEVTASYATLSPYPTQILISVVIINKNGGVDRGYFGKNMVRIHTPLRGWIAGIWFPVFSSVAYSPNPQEVSKMPVIYIAKEHYDELIKRDEIPKEVIDGLLREYLKVKSV